MIVLKSFAACDEHFSGYLPALIESDKTATLRISRMVTPIEDYHCGCGVSATWMAKLVKDSFPIVTVMGADLTELKKICGGLAASDDYRHVEIMIDDEGIKFKARVPGLSSWTPGLGGTVRHVEL